MDARDNPGRVNGKVEWIRKSVNADPRNRDIMYEPQGEEKTENSPE
jgi:hypothetical protein